MEKELEKNERETLEEARVNNLIKLFGIDFDLEPSHVIESCNDSFIEGAKWQQEQNKNLYSEEDLREAKKIGSCELIKKSDCRLTESGDLIYKNNSRYKLYPRLDIYHDYNNFENIDYLYLKTALQLGDSVKIYKLKQLFKNGFNFEELKKMLQNFEDFILAESLNK